MLLQNKQENLINLMASEDCLPKGGLPIICILLSPIFILEYFNSK